VRWSRRSVEARGSIASSYRSSLFSAEYGRDYYRGYVDSIGVPGVLFPPPVPGVRAAATAPTGRRKLAIAAASIAGASLVASATAVVLAIGARRDFEATNLQRPALEARQRYDRDRTLAGATGIIAIGAGVAAYWLWPRATTVTPLLSAGGSYGIAVAATW